MVQVGHRSAQATGMAEIQEMTVSIDTDNDGDPEATFPLKWVAVFIAVLTGCSSFGQSFL